MHARARAHTHTRARARAFIRVHENRVPAPTPTHYAWVLQSKALSTEPPIINIIVTAFGHALNVHRRKELSKYTDLESVAQFIQTSILSNFASAYRSEHLTDVPCPCGRVGPRKDDDQRLLGFESSKTNPASSRIRRISSVGNPSPRS